MRCDFVDFFRRCRMVEDYKSLLIHWKMSGSSQCKLKEYSIAGMQNSPVFKINTENGSFV